MRALRRTIIRGGADNAIFLREEYIGPYRAFVPLVAPRLAPLAAFSDRIRQNRRLE
jgi:hypothetical protein